MSITASAEEHKPRSRFTRLLLLVAMLSCGDASVSRGGADYPAAVVTNALQRVYDQAPGRASAKGNRVSSELKTPAANASMLPGGARTVRGNSIFVPSGVPSDYSGWDLTGFQLFIDGDNTSVTIRDCTLSAAGPLVTMGSGQAGSIGSVVVKIDWSTLDGTKRGPEFAGGIYAVGGRVDLTITNSRYVADRVNFFTKANTTGNWLIAENYFGPFSQGGRSGEHTEALHEMGSVGAGFTVRVSRNFFDGRDRNGAVTATGYLFSENTSGRIDWRIEDNIFLGFGDKTSTQAAAWAFQFAGIGRIVMNNNIVQQASGFALNNYVVNLAGASLTISGANNRAWPDGGVILQAGLTR